MMGPDKLDSAVLSHQQGIPTMCLAHHQIHIPDLEVHQNDYGTVRVYLGGGGDQGMFPPQEDMFPPQNIMAK